MKKFLISIYFVSILFSMPQLDAQISMTAIKEHFQNHKYKYFIAAAGVKLLGLLYLSNCGKKSKKQRTRRSSEVPNDLAEPRNSAAYDAASNCGGGGGGAASVAASEFDVGIVKTGTIISVPGGYWFSVDNTKCYEIRNYEQIYHRIREIRKDETVKVKLTKIALESKCSGIRNVADVEILYEMGKTYEIYGKVKRGNGAMSKCYYLEVNNNLEFWISEARSNRDRSISLESVVDQEARLSVKMIKDYDSDGKKPTMAITSLEEEAK